jgi:hypothetical protein
MTLKVDVVQNTSGGPVTLTQQSAAKAWSNFNGSTFGARDSFNQTSFVDNGTGSYKIGFINSMSNGNYSIVATAGTGGVYGSYNAVHGGAADIVSSQYEVFTFVTQSPSINDVDTVTTQVSGDLA